MDRKQLCVANLRYKRPSPSEAKSMKNLLGYLTYRDSRDQGARMVAGVERWIDHGMGKSVKSIAQRCQDLRSDHVLTFSLVVNPNPQLVAMIPKEQREAFVRQLTEQVVDEFFDARGLDSGCEYSYVLHHRESDDLQTPGLHNPHTHVVLPGTVWNEDHAQRIPLYFSRNKKVNHIEMLHEITENNMTDLLDSYIGLDWEQRINTLERLRYEQKQITETAPHGITMNEDGHTLPFWGGIRQVDEDQCAVGYYLPFSENDGGKRRPPSSALLLRVWVMIMPTASAPLWQANCTAIRTPTNCSSIRIPSKPYWMKMRLRLHNRPTPRCLHSSWSFSPMKDDTMTQELTRNKTSDAATHDLHTFLRADFLRALYGSAPDDLYLELRCIHPVTGEVQTLWRQNSEISWTVEPSYLPTGRCA